MPEKVEMKLKVGLTEEQKFWAKQLLMRDAGILIRAEKDDLDKVSHVYVYHTLSLSLPYISDILENNIYAGTSVSTIFSCNYARSVIILG